MEQLASPFKTFILLKVDLVMSWSNYIVRGEASPAGALAIAKFL
jgi:hypothetical protein